MVVSIGIRECILNERWTDQNTCEVCPDNTMNI